MLPETHFYSRITSVRHLTNNTATFRDFDTEIGGKGSQLSGGQKRKYLPFHAIYHQFDIGLKI